GHEGAIQGALPEVCTVRVGSTELSAREIDSVQIRECNGGIRKIRFGQFDSAPSRARQLQTREISSAKIQDLVAIPELQKSVHPCLSWQLTVFQDPHKGLDGIHMTWNIGVVANQRRNEKDGDSSNDGEFQRLRGRKWQWKLTAQSRCPTKKAGAEREAQRQHNDGKHTGIV